MKSTTSSPISYLPITLADVFCQALVYDYERTSTVNQKRLKLNGSLYGTYNFDNDERLSNIVNASDSTTIGYTYYNDDTVQTRTYPNGVSTSYEFDNMRRLKRLTDTGPSGTLFDRQYGYNSANQISQITELTGTRMFGYDNVNRLTNVTGSATESYLFDDVGNRTSSHRASSYGYQSGQFSRLTSAVTPSQTLTYGFDANGNTTTKSEGSNFWRYTWDYENRMSEAATRKQKVRYKFDALGRRVSRNVGYGNELTKFTYDGYDVLVDDNFGLQTKYLNGDGIDNKLRTQTGNSVSYFLADHLGSTTGLANSSGSLASSNSYDSFGNQTNLSFPSRYQFTGREFDSFSGLQFSRARFYDSNLGRFLSEDPIGLSGGINQYGYVTNNPLNATDPYGLYEIDVHYYLTYYLARQNGCFTEIEAQYIAFSNQFVDDNSATSPGWGGDPRQRRINRENHALHPGDHDMYMNKRWQGTNSGSWPSRLSALGSTLHYQQDTYSHKGYTNPIYGHLPGTHSVDKTDSDVDKAMAMAQATFNTLNAFSSKHCKCVGQWTPEMTDQVQKFAALPGGNFITRYIDSIENNNPVYLNNKKSALGF